MTAIPTITLNDGRAIPQLGLGVYQVEPQDTADVVGRALGLGYRHIDTAEMYGNERGVGEGVRTSGVDREQIWVTSKLDNDVHEPDDARRAFGGTLAELGLDAVDLFLIHWPLPTRYGGDFVSTWRVLEELKADGRARSIGVSNFQIPHLQRLLDECEVVPAVNQIEAHPYFRNDELRAFGAEHGIATEAWSPIARGRVLREPRVQEVARHVDRTAAQVVLRWHLERGDIIFPKARSVEHLRDNMAALDFTLTPEDHAALDELDRGPEGRIGPDPDVFDWIG